MKPGKGTFVAVGARSRHHLTPHVYLVDIMLPAKRSTMAGSTPQQQLE